MKQLFIILGLISAILTTILSVLPFSNMVVFPAAAALVFALIAFYLSKKAGYVNKIIQFTFLLTIVSLSITIYKAVFNSVEIANTEELIIKEEESKKEALEEL